MNAKESKIIDLTIIYSYYNYKKEGYLVEQIKETIEIGSLDSAESKALKYFIEAYTNCETKQLERIEKEQLRRIRGKEEISTNN